MVYKNLRASQVMLDPANPRLPDGTSSDREAINRLLDDGAEALINLARDMAQTGQTNPAELPIAVKFGTKYLVLEGNRRFAALKLLDDPALADDIGSQKAFRRAAALGTPPKTIYTLVAESREEADHWIVLRHTGENNGVGVKRWSAGQTAIHRKRANVTVDAGTIRSITIADELEEAYSNDQELLDLIRQTRRGKLTNIGRFFSPDVLAALHMSIEASEASTIRTRSLLTRHTASQLRDFFVWAFDYIRNNSVDAYKNAAIRKQALELASHLIPGPSEASVQPQRLADRAFGATGAPASQNPASGSGTSYSPSSSATPGTQSPPSPATPAPQAGVAQSPTQQPTPGSKQGPRREAKPERFLFQGLRLPNHPPRIQQLLKECRNLAMEEYPGVGCVMARVLVELSVSCSPVLALSGAQESDRLKDKIISALKHLDPQIEHVMRRDKTLAQAYIEASELGMQYLNGVVHNPAVQPDVHLARRFSLSFRPLLEQLDGAL